MTRNGEVIYIAAPYSHEEPAVREYRVRCATVWAAHLLRQDPCPVVFSPITHSHPIAVYGNLPRDFAFWNKQDIHFLGMCTTIHVLGLSGYRSSVGVREEVAWARRMGKMVFYIPEKKVIEVGKQLSELT